MVDLVKEKFRTDEYDFGMMWSLCLYNHDCKNNKIHKDVPNIDFVNEFESAISSRGDKLIPYNKLSAVSYGDASIKVTKIPIEYFNDRDELDRIFYANNYGYYHENGTNVNTGTNIDSIENIHRISIYEVFEKLDIPVNPNTEYYLYNREELTKDIGHTLVDDITEELVESLKQELFYNLMCNIFGDKGYNTVEDRVKKKYIWLEILEL